MLFDGEPRLSHKRFAQLERSLSQAGRVRPSPLEGPEWILGAMEDHARRLQSAARLGDEVSEPASIAYFVVPFRQVARSMRRDWRHRGAAAGERRTRSSSQRSETKGSAADG